MVGPFGLQALLTSATGQKLGFKRELAGFAKLTHIAVLRPQPGMIRRKDFLIIG